MNSDPSATTSSPAAPDTPAKLRSEQERLLLTEYALDHAQDLVSILDREGNRLYVNETFCRFTGWSREEVMAFKAWKSTPSLNEKSFRKLWDQIKASGAETFDLELLTHDGTLKPVEINASYLNFGGREAVCTISRDVSVRRAAEEELQKMQQQLQETQKLESLGVLAGGIAHDFNNLLTGVLGNAGLARDRLAEKDPLHDQLRQIEIAATRAAELCQQMLAYAGKGHFVVEPVDLSVLVSDTAKLLDLSVAHRAQLDLRLATDLPSVFADGTQLRQIVMNLVLNAAEAINHSDGVITVTTGRIQIDAELLSSTRIVADLSEGDGVYLEVSDNGCGMDSDTLARVFEPFFTTKFTGRGLGLAAVLGIVRSHHGALDVQSEIGRGTRFRLVLPAYDSPGAAKAGTVSPFPVERAQQGTILVIDDEESVRSVTRDALRRIGYEVVTAEDGRSALDLLQRPMPVFSAVLLDYTMPKLDGAETLRAIQQLRPELPVILMSGFPEAETEKRLEGLTVASFLPKPFNISLLRKCVEQTIEKAR